MDVSDKKMALVDIPSFVHEILAAGCEIVAVDNLYVIAVDDLPEPLRSDVEPKVAAITARYGTRDHLVSAIAAYLTSTGRVHRSPGAH